MALPQTSMMAKDSHISTQGYSDTGLDVTQACRVFFLLASSTVLFINSVSPFRERFLAYGSRSSPAAPQGADTKDTTKQGATTNPAVRLLDQLKSLQVPHSWFTHFYIVSVASSIFWAIQAISHGGALRWIASHATVVTSSHGSSTMSLSQTAVAWLFMFAQGSRRLYECITLSKPSQSKMFVAHWILGLAFYLVMSVAIWIEGAGKSLRLRYIGAIAEQLCSRPCFWSYPDGFDGGRQALHQDYHCLPYLCGSFGDPA